MSKPDMDAEPERQRLAEKVWNVEFERDHYLANIQKLLDQRDIAARESEANARAAAVTTDALNAAVRQRDQAIAHLRAMLAEYAVEGEPITTAARLWLELQ